MENLSEDLIDRIYFYIFLNKLKDLNKEHINNFSWINWSPPFSDRSGNLCCRYDRTKIITPVIWKFGTNLYCIPNPPEYPLFYSIRKSK